MQTTRGSEPLAYKSAVGQLRPTLIFAGLFSAIVNLLMLTGPIYMLLIYDRVLSSASVPTLMQLFAVVVVLYAFLGVYDFLRKRLLSRAGNRLDALIGKSAFAKRVQVVSPGGECEGNPLRDLGIVRSFLSSPAILGLFDLPWIPIFVGVVFLIHPILGWILLLGALLAVVIALVNERLTRRSTLQALTHEAEEREFVEISRRNAETVQALGMQEAIAAHWQGLRRVGLNAILQGGNRSEILSSGSRVYRLLLQSVILTGAAYLALQQEITAGMIVATSILSGRALAPVDQVIGNWRSIARAAEAHRGLSTALISAAKPVGISLPAPKGSVALKGVVKLVPGYEDAREQPWILKDVEFSLNPGDGLGVIGSSAAGKSSLAKLLIGAWQPDGGEVRLDGATLDQWAPDTLGQHVGYLPQSVEMLPGTIKENLARFDRNADEAAVLSAARLADVHRMILSLPNGYDTRIGASGQPLSGGQVQRLGIARALYGGPSFLVLDEPNAHLDAAGEEVLLSTIELMRARGSTVVIMAHRPSALQPVNKVLILHKGQVVRFGDKEAILQKNMQPVGIPRRSMPSAS